MLWWLNNLQLSHIQRKKMQGCSLAAALNELQTDIKILKVKLDLRSTPKPTLYQHGTVSDSTMAALSIAKMSVKLPSAYSKH